jgi:DNA topoisomerase-6 subunit A
MKKKKSEGTVIPKIKGIANDIYKKILKQKQPELVAPLRSLTNVKYDPKDGYFELLGKKKKRTLTAGTVKTFAQTLKMMTLSKELVEQDDIATKREAYYVSKNWKEARFREQQESDTVMDDIESMMMVNREQLGFIQENLLLLI